MKEIFLVEWENQYLGVGERPVFWYQSKHHKDVYHYTTYKDALNAIEQLPDNFINKAIFRIEKYYIKILPNDGR